MHEPKVVKYQPHASIEISRSSSHLASRTLSLPTLHTQALSGNHGATWLWTCWVELCVHSSAGVIRSCKTPPTHHHKQSHQTPSNPPMCHGQGITFNKETEAERKEVAAATKVHPDVKKLENRTLYAQLQANKEAAEEAAAALQKETRSTQPPNRQKATTLTCEPGCDSTPHQQKTQVVTVALTMMK